MISVQVCNDVWTTVEDFADDDVALAVAKRDELIAQGWGTASIRLYKHPRLRLVKNE